MAQSRPDHLAEYASLEIAALLSRLSSSEHGLGHTDVLKQRERCGPNSVGNLNNVIFDSIRRQFKSPFIYAYAAVGLLSFMLYEIVNGIIVICCVAVQLSVSFFQEYKASRNLELLKKYLLHSVRVKRDGTLVTLSSTELVPGDIVLLQAGDMVSADCRILEAYDLSVDESALTGEAIPVAKDIHAQENRSFAPATYSTILYAGTAIATGQTKAVVLFTGNASLIGMLDTLALNTLQESNIVRGTARLGAALFWLISGGVGIAFSINLALKHNALSFIDMVTFSTALAITTIPEALPIVLSFCLSQGASYLARQKVVVKRLSAIEDLGAIELLCADKTGTLTQNRLSVAATYPTHDTCVLTLAAASSPDIIDALTSSSMEPTAQQLYGFDKALMDAATIQSKAMLKEYTIVSYIPFNPALRRTITLTAHNGTHLVIARGSTQDILELCSVSADVQERVCAWSTAQETAGNRVLALGTKKVASSITTLEHDEHALDFAGMVSFTDPLKESTALALEQARALGITIKIVSGDTQQVCAAVGKKLGIITSMHDVITGSEFERKSDEEKRKAVEQYALFARTTPEQKHEIIQLLQLTHTVGYIGDGINDVPALKTAHVSLVVSDAVAIAREAADIILLEKNLLVVIKGIKEGRKIFINTIKYITITLTGNLGNFFSLSIATLGLHYLPMLPVQLLLVSLLSDFPMLAIATDTVSTQELTSSKRSSIRSIAVLVMLCGVINTLFDLILFALATHAATKSADQHFLQTSWFIFDTITTVALIFSLRTQGPFYRAHRPSYILYSLTLFSITTALVLPYTLVGQKALQLIVLPYQHLVTLIAVAVAYLAITDVVKYGYYHLQKRAS